MLLVIDTGNTTVHFAVYKLCGKGYDGNNSFLVHEFKMLTKKIGKETILNKIEKELSKVKLNSSVIKDIAICSVVPSVFKVLSNVLRCIFPHIIPFVINTKCKTNIDFSFVNNPDELGADIIALCQGVSSTVKCFKKPCTIVCLGTATTFSLIDENCTFLGMSIAPGLGASLNSLAGSAELLSDVLSSESLNCHKFPKVVINTNTKDCILSGIIYGHASLVDGMCTRIKKEVGQQDSIVILTGGYSKIISEYLQTEYIYIPELILKGIQNIYFLNNE